MQTITPHLWFDKEAKQAAELYKSIFKDSEIKNSVTLHNTPSGSVDLLTIELLGQEFKLINAGPLFKFTPAVSFLVACNTKDEVDALWHGRRVSTTLRHMLMGFSEFFYVSWTGLLIHASVGTAGGLGALRTKRSG
jgi:predicted 3-demethylubiquinone-9 3-methyltransferase (glyoxalase superfamily)